MKDELIDWKELDSDFRDRVLSETGGDSVKLCYSCGACTGVCPAAALGVGFSPSRIARLVLWGAREEVLGSALIWYCLMCHRCYLRCPQGVRFGEVVEILREMAVREGFADEELPRRLAEAEELLKELRRELVKEAVLDTGEGLTSAAMKALKEHD